MSDIDFTGWEVPPGFTTFEIVERIQGPIRGTDGTVSYGARDYCYGVGHTAHLPHGGRLTVTPGDRNSYTAAGYYLAAYDSLDNWVWGQRFPNVHAALSEGRSHLRVAEYLYNATRNPYVGDGADGCLRSARIIRRRPIGSTSGIPGARTCTTPPRRGGPKPTALPPQTRPPPGLGVPRPS